MPILPRISLPQIQQKLLQMISLLPYILIQNPLTINNNPQYLRLHFKLQHTTITEKKILHPSFTQNWWCRLSWLLIKRLFVNMLLFFASSPSPASHRWRSCHQLRWNLCTSRTECRRNIALWCYFTSISHPAFPRNCRKSPLFSSARKPPRTRGRWWSPAKPIFPCPENPSARQVAAKNATLKKKARWYLFLVLRLFSRRKQNLPAHITIILLAAVGGSQKCFLYHTHTMRKSIRRHPNMLLLLRL